MTRPRIRLGWVVLVLVGTVGLVAVAGPAAGGASRGRAPAEIVMVTHGEASDSFWSIVKNAVDEAAVDYDVEVSYHAPPMFDMVDMRRLVEAAVAREPDGLAVTIPDPDALEDPIKEAVDAGIPVIAFNSGSTVALDFGAMAYIGQSEEQAGFRGGREMVEAGITKALCVNHSVGTLSLEERCRGFLDALGKSGVEGQQLAVDGSDVTGAQLRIEAALEEDPEVDGILTLGPAGAIPTLAALRNSGRMEQITYATFDLSPEVLKAVGSGNALFAIDQQPYLQGYLAVAALAQNAQRGVHPVGSVRTGPSFVTEEEAAEILPFSELGLR